MKETSHVFVSYGEKQYKKKILIYKGIHWEKNLLNLDFSSATWILEFQCRFFYILYFYIPYKNRKKILISLWKWVSITFLNEFLLS